MFAQLCTYVMAVCSFFFGGGPVNKYFFFGATMRRADFEKYKHGQIKGTFLPTNKGTYYVANVGGNMVWVEEYESSNILRCMLRCQLSEVGGAPEP